MNALNGEELQGARLEISLAKVIIYFNILFLVNTNKSAATIGQEEEGGDAEGEGAEGDSDHS